MASGASSSARRASSPAPSDGSTDSSNTPIHALDATADDEWADVTPDTEDLEFKSLFDSSQFSDIQRMVEYDSETWEFNLKDYILKLGLDFYGCIRLVNYVRSQVLNGNTDVKIATADAFADDKYLQPVLEDDAVLFGLDDLLSTGQAAGEKEYRLDDNATESRSVANQQPSLQELQNELEKLRKQFSDYRHAVEQTLEQRWGASGTELRDDQSKPFTSADIAKEDDEGYFNSYGYNEIHETMLKDEVRTSAYRDIMYDNKHLFSGKTVLDVGCGTGILSMFAAKAGAKYVYAVDNSSIITKAREIVAENGLQDRITCIKGKVEDIVLPTNPTANHNANGEVESSGQVAKIKQGTVDIIISEWFGYCLLYENMLDSVLQARDLYLTQHLNSSTVPSTPASGPLMLPSHTTLHIGPLSDPDYITSSITFWHSVYGFNMSAMLEPTSTPHNPSSKIQDSQPSTSTTATPPAQKSSIYDEIAIRTVNPSAVPGDSTRFKSLNLYTASRADLEFTSPFALTLSRDVPDGLDGFVIWFDVFFLTSSMPNRASNGVDAPTMDAHADELLPADARAESYPGQGKEQLGVAFTTGPAGPETHWKQGCLLIDRGVGTGGTRVRAPVLAKGQRVTGTIRYAKGRLNTRQLEVEITWDAPGTDEKGRQIWYLR